MTRRPLSVIAKSGWPGIGLAVLKSFKSNWANAGVVTTKVIVNTIASTSILVIIRTLYDGSGVIDTRSEREGPSSYGVVALSFGDVILEEAPSMLKCKPSTGKETIHRSAWKGSSPKSVCDFLYSPSWSGRSAIPRVLENIGPIATCGQHTYRFALLDAASEVNATRSPPLQSNLSSTARA
jgi:hypothetical protein